MSDASVNAGKGWCLELKVTRNGEFIQHQAVRAPDRDYSRSMMDALTFCLEDDLVKKGIIPDPLADFRE